MKSLISYRFLNIKKKFKKWYLNGLVSFSKKDSPPLPNMEKHGK